MRIKSVLSAVLFAMVTQVCISQTATTSVVTAAGGYHENDMCSLSWTMGEPVIETDSSDNAFITQGFQQPENIIINDESNVQSLVTQVTAYPNPVSGIVHIKSTSGEPLVVYIEGLEGQSFGNKRITSQDNVLNLGELANGIYLLRVYNTGKQLIQTLKIDKIQ